MGTKPRIKNTKPRHQTLELKNPDLVKSLAVATLNVQIKWTLKSVTLPQFISTTTMGIKVYVF